jgi:hypothetical protein
VKIDGNCVAAVEHTKQTLTRRRAERALPTNAIEQTHTRFLQTNALTMESMAASKIAEGRANTNASESKHPRRAADVR